MELFGLPRVTEPDTPKDCPIDAEPDTPKESKFPCPPTCIPWFPTYRGAVGALV